MRLASRLAPRPDDHLFAWSKQIASGRIIPFPSVHPADPEMETRIRQVADAGFKGLKIHPYYQQFDLIEERMMVFFRAAADAGLIVVCHTGFDIAFPHYRIIELSLWSTFATADQLRAFLKRHDPSRVLFGTDAPWSDQAGSLAELRALNLPPADLELILCGNARRLLGE